MRNFRCQRIEQCWLLVEKRQATVENERLRPDTNGIFVNNMFKKMHKRSASTT